MKGNKSTLLSLKLLNKMGSTHIISLLFSDSLPKLVCALFCYENHSNGHFSNANELTVLAPKATK